MINNNQYKAVPLSQLITEYRLFTDLLNIPRKDSKNVCDIIRLRFGPGWVGFTYLANPDQPENPRVQPRGPAGFAKYAKMI